MHGILKQEKDEYVLKCDRVIEAEVYRKGFVHSTWNRLKELQCPSTLMIAENSISLGESKNMRHPKYLDHVDVGKDMAKEFKNTRSFEFCLLPDTSHFIPMEQPHFVAQKVKDVSITNRNGSLLKDNS